MKINILDKNNQGYIWIIILIYNYKKKYQMITSLNCIEKQITVFYEMKIVRLITKFI